MRPSKRWQGYAASLGLLIVTMGNMEATATPHVEDFLKADGSPDFARIEASGHNGRVLLLGYSSAAVQGDAPVVLPRSALRSERSERTEAAYSPTIEMLAVHSGKLFSLVASQGGARSIVQWGEDSWVPIANEIDGRVRSLSVHEDELVIAGSFTRVDGVSIHGVARWNGDDWSPLGQGLDGSVRAISVFEDRLYAAGALDPVAGSAPGNVAVWDGRSWSSVANGLDGSVSSLAIFDGALLAAGRFEGDEETHRLMRLGEGAWTPFGPELPGRPLELRAEEDRLVVYGTVARGDGVRSEYVASIGTLSRSEAPGPRLESVVQFRTPHPNPASGACRLSYSLPKAGPVQLAIYDAAGRRLELLFDGFEEAGEHTRVWAPAADTGRTAGVYFARLTAAGTTHTQKLVLLR